VIIRPASGAEHTGTAGTGDNIDPNTSGSHVFLIQEATADVTIEGIVITNSGASASDGAIRIAPAADCGTSTYTIRGCIIHDLDDSQSDGIYFYRNSPTVVVENCAIYNCGRAQLHFQQHENNTAYSGTVTVRNCTLYGGSYGIGISNIAPT